MSKRLVKVAKELNIGTKTIVEFLNGNGFSVSNKPTAKITDEMFDLLAKNFQNNIAIKEKANQITIGTRKTKEEQQKEKLKSWKENAIIEGVDESRKEDTKEESPQLKGLKILEKINISRKYKRLVKVAKDLNVGTKTIVEFLNSNGFSMSNKPTTKISNEMLVILTKEFDSSRSLKEKANYDLLVKQANERQKKLLDEHNSNKMNMDDDKLKEGEENIIEERLKKDFEVFNQLSPKSISNIQITLGNPLIRRLTEYVIGVSHYSWKYWSIQFEGTSSKPKPFSLLDETVCKIIEIKDISLAGIANIMGFNIEDNADKAILERGIQKLKQEKIVDGDDSYLYLTTEGKKYVSKGAKFETYTIKFPLTFCDLSLGKEITLEEVNSHKKENSVQENFDLNLVEEQNLIKKQAILQAPKAHSPKDGFELIDYTVSSSYSYSEDSVFFYLRDKEQENKLRILVFMSKDGNYNSSLTELANDKLDLFEEIVEIEFKENHEIEQEVKAILSSTQKILDDLIKEDDKEGLEKFLVQYKKSSPRSFSSLEFEEELKRVYEEADEELWLISPWVKDFALNKRKRDLEKYLKKGARLFIGYSEAELSDAEKNIQDSCLQLFQSWETKYPNFYFQELSLFHYKKMFVFSKSGIKNYYSGSYNMMSFHASPKRRKVREENMIRLPLDESSQNYLSKFKESFANKYLNMAIDTLKNEKNSNDSVLSRDIDFDKKRLNTFSFKKNKKFDNYELDFLQYQTQIVRKKDAAKFKKLESEVKRIQKPIFFSHKKELFEKFDGFKNNPMISKHEIENLKNKIKSLQVRGNRNKKSRPNKNKKK